MQLTLERNILLENLELVQTIANARTTLPILNNILVEVPDAEATEGPTDIILTANNLEMAVGVATPALVLESGVTTIPCRKFYEIVKEIPIGSNINLTVDGDNYISVEYEQGKSKIKGLDPEEFPAQPDIEETSFTLEGPDFINLIEQTVFAASLEEVRYFLNAVNFIFSAEKTLTIATDGRRLATATAQPILEAGKDTQSFILPLKTAREALKVFAGSTSISVSLSQGQIAFTDGRAVLTGRLIEGDYPDHNKLIPAETKNEVSVNKNALASAIRRVALLADPRNYSVLMSVNATSVNLEVETPDLGEATEEIILKDKYNGEEMLFKFDARLFLDGLNQIKTENVKFQFNTSHEVVLLRPGSGEAYLNLLMPLRLDEEPEADEAAEEDEAPGMIEQEAEDIATAPAEPEAVSMEQF